MGSSQLKQLKAAISTSGLSNSSSGSRKRKRQNTAEGPAALEHRDKRTEKLKEIHEKFNPFDVKVEKLKHDVGGRKIKGTVGKPSASKQAGIEQVWLSSAVLFRTLLIHVYREKRRYLLNMKQKIKLVDWWTDDLEKTIQQCPSRSECSPVSPRSVRGAARAQCTTSTTKMN